jgi:catechol 2,3-dioxygenase-like lactoylglutathione lyase family enzyme
MNLQNPNKLFPLILTAKLEATKQFYVEKLGFRVVYDLPTYLQLAYGDGDAPELCFMKPDAFPDGKTLPAFDGRGVYVSVPTPSADEKYAALQLANVELLSKPEDKPWGWRSFLVADPSGLVLDFFHVYKAPEMK